MSDEKELEEFPILCETCLGDNPMIRMTRQPHAKACKICDRPFTVYRWRPGGQESRYKKTELCRTCAKLKNVCQTCVLDLQYGLPVQVRDTALEEHEKLKIPQSDVGREYMIEQLEREQDSVGGGSGHALAYGATSQPPAILATLQRRAPYYKRNASHLCSFFARGACNRGALCPYRHEMPTSGPLAKQNIKDRYFGVNDPVANKMLSRMSQTGPALAPPSDPSITTLWVGGIQDSTVTEGDIRQAFHSYGEIINVSHVPVKQCAFVTFQRRAQAEEAATKLQNKLQIKGTYLKLAWGKKDGQAGRLNDQSSSTATSTSSSSSSSTPPGIHSSTTSSDAPATSTSTSTSTATSTSSGAPAFVAPNYLTGPLPPGMKQKKTVYASQDPHQMAAKLPV